MSKKKKPRNRPRRGKAAEVERPGRPDESIADTLRRYLLHVIEGRDRHVGAEPVSVNYMAKVTGVSQSVLHHFLTGQRDIRLETAARLAKAVGMWLTWESR